MKILGVDPGMEGYFSCLENGEYANSWPMPTYRIGKGKSNRQAFDVVQIHRDIFEYGPDLIVIEKQHDAGPVKKGKFTTGYGYGLLIMAASICECRVIVVAAKTWQKVMHKDIPGNDTKTKSIIACQRLFPGVDLRATEKCRKLNDNKAEAILLGYYGYLSIEVN